VFEKINSPNFLGRLKAGDEEALNFAIKALAGPLTRDLRNLYGLREDDAEEIVVESWLKICRKVGAFEPKDAKLTTWIFKVVRNTAVDHLRKQARLNSISGEEESLGREDDPEHHSRHHRPRFCFEPFEEIEESPLLLRLRYALECLKESDRDILLMWQVLTVKEIAYVENVSEAGACMRYNRALKQLNLALERPVERRGSPASPEGTTSL
jgi:RNA polymerase sigma factor (sigma-70 family)